MSGYLQRIVSHAKAPTAETGIRPLVRPMYAASAVSSFGEVHEEIAAAAPGLSARELPHVQTSAETSAPQRFRQETAVTRDVPLFQMESPRMASGEVVHEVMQSQRIEPLMPQSSSADFSSAAIGQGAEMDLADASRPAGIAATTTMNLPRPPAEAVREHQPIMPRQARSGVLSSLQTAPAQVTQVSDEIHINIGRIEVTAVPQGPAPRPAPRAPRRAFSLDEYLRKSDGRAQ